MVTINSLITTKATHETENILNEFLVYENNKLWYRYDSAAIFDETKFLIERILNHKIAALKPNKDTTLYSNKPGAVLRGPISSVGPYGPQMIIHSFLYSNVAIFLLVFPTYIRFILFCEKEFIDSTKIFPTPELLIYHKLTSGLEDIELPEFYFLDPHLKAGK